MKLESHARFDALERTYHYFISKNKNPFNQELFWYLRKDLDLETMNKAATILYEFEDFTSFSKLHTDTPHNLCKIHLAKFTCTKNCYLFRS